MQKKFIYHEKTSELYSFEGKLLKTIHCPKAKDWNQLITDDESDRSRGCKECGERVLNLDVIPYKEVVAAFEGTSRWNAPCVYARLDSDSVLVLKDDERPVVDTHASFLPELPDEGKPMHIQTARGIKDINRAASMGFWPDVHLVKYDPRRIKSKFELCQNQRTGKVALASDYRRSCCSLPDCVEVIPFTYYYPGYQSFPVAAYLIPRDTADETPVIVQDPIEDIVGATWNQGNVYRATNVPGVIRNMSVVLFKEQVRPTEIMG